jgi:hypothetical protein
MNAALVTVAAASTAITAHRNLRGPSRRDWPTGTEGPVDAGVSTGSA